MDENYTQCTRDIRTRFKHSCIMILRIKCDELYCNEFKCIEFEICIEFMYIERFNIEFE